MTDLPTSLDPDVVIVGIEFADDWAAMELTYIERRNVAPNAFKRETVSFDTSLLPEGEVREVFDIISEWRDAALLHIRTEGEE